MVDCSVNIFDNTGTVSGDSSLNLLSKDEFVELIVPKVQEILNKRFPDNPAKRRIKVYKDRISFAAPCCGDSASIQHRKRGNIILEGKFKNLYKCFNCGTCMSLPNFFKSYGKDLSLREINYIVSNKASFQAFSGTFDTGVASLLYDESEVEKYALKREVFRDMLKLEECERNFGEQYLNSRHQYDKSKFLYSSAYNKLFVLNLTSKGYVIGFQVRHFKGDAKYKTYNLQKIHDYILKDGITVPDELNSISMIFNILNIDCTKMVTVTEGPMDAFLLKNCVALCGAAKNVDFPFEHRYLFDCDETGKQHTIDKLKAGHYVFLWDKYLNDNGLPKRKKWDVNDLINYSATKNVNLSSLEGYFTNDELDLIYI